MKEFLIFLALIIPSVLLLIFLLKKIFKHSMLYTFGVIWMVAQSVLVTEAYGIGKLGTLYDFIWGFPAGISFTILGMIYLARRYKKVLIDTSSSIQKLSTGDLNVQIDERNLNRKDEVGMITVSLHKLIEQLSEVVNKVKSSSDQVLTASNQLSSTSEQLSQGATEQASSLEEVSSTMQQIVSNIANNTQNAKDTAGIASESSDGIKLVNKASMDSLESVRNITQKISVINEIALQTNILALNASVEAARAGDAGKGFAVVAAEVRKLAVLTKVASDEIMVLAESSLQVTEKAGEQMNEVVPKIEKTTGLVQEIAAASIEQNSGAEQVNASVQQLNNVTMQNSSVSEEMASSAEEMASQAKHLKEMISFFKV